jgi:hypothetical protein
VKRLGKGGSTPWINKAQLSTIAIAIVGMKEHKDSLVA